MVLAMCAVDAVENTSIAADPDELSFWSPRYKMNRVKQTGTELVIGGPDKRLDAREAFQFITKTLAGDDDGHDMTHDHHCIVTKPDAAFLVST